MEINVRILEKLGVRSDRAQRYGPSFTTDLPRYNIDTPLRQAHFLAQVLHESGMCRYTKENLNYSAQGLRAVFGRYFPSDEIASQYQRQPERIGSRVYANRMGNGDEASGDGYHYRGRGLIQLTGRNNYLKFSQWSGENVVDEPERVAHEFPVLSALFYWDTNNLNQYADEDDLRTLTKRINGGYNGLAHREELLLKAKALLVEHDQSNEPDRYRVIASRLNLRKEPIVADNVITQLDRDSEVYVLEDAGNGWAQVKTIHNNMKGYVSARYLRMV